MYHEINNQNVSFLIRNADFFDSPNRCPSGNNNPDSTVNIPFGRIVKWYLNNIPMLKVCWLKHSESENNSTDCKRIKHATDAIDFIEWKTKQGTE
ncbi:8101_t:CDS:2 [Funneliformis geosporum]|uniref:17169_t:CDS:1 n=1 Tax=Funneliformis geosporum TaxID=1117311 RepID=A0A9W4SSE4_9GLOM|nr:8101_t:CDS:2 [Funneliformis geosporum]CAI2177458.1 17169_t:CDS:2 [Funneliformis geosporum]